MPVWSWIVNLTLWAISTCLTGFGIRFLLKGVRDLKRAKWSEYSDQYVEFLNSYKEQSSGYQKMTKEYNEMISRIAILLKQENSIPDILKLGETLQEYYTALMTTIKGNTASVERQIDTLNDLRTFAEKGGKTGFSSLNQIEATKNITIAAVLMAFSGIGFSISSAILSIVSIVK